MSTSKSTCVADELTMIRVDEPEAVYRMARVDRPWFSPRLLDVAVRNFIASKTPAELRDVVADLDRVAAARPADYLPWGRLDDVEAAVRDAAASAVRGQTLLTVDASYNQLVAAFGPAGPPEDNDKQWHCWKLLGGSVRVYDFHRPADGSPDPAKAPDLLTRWRINAIGGDHQDAAQTVAARIADVAETDPWGVGAAPAADPDCIAERISDAWARAYPALRDLHHAFDDYMIARHGGATGPALTLTTAQAAVLLNRIGWVEQDLAHYRDALVVDDDRTKCQCPAPCGAPTEQCHYCGRDLAHDFVHWNGDRYSCEDCGGEYPDTTAERAAAEPDPRLRAVDVRVKAATCYVGTDAGGFVPARCDLPTPDGGRCTHVITHEVSETAGHGTGYTRCCVWHLDDAVKRATELATAAALRRPLDQPTPDISDQMADPLRRDALAYVLALDEGDISEQIEILDRYQGDEKDRLLHEVGLIARDGRPALDDPDAQLPF